MKQNELEKLIIRVAKLRDKGTPFIEAIKQATKNKATRKKLIKAIDE